MTPGRFLRVGDSPYPWEREAIEFAFAAMPDLDPFHARALVDLVDPGTGSLYEIDLLVIGFSAIYLVEIKSHPGKIAGDEVDWTWTSPEGVTRYLENPLRLANHKAKVLRGLLDKDLRKAKSTERVPWVQPLIFLSAEGLALDLTPAGNVAVVTRNTLAKALRFHDFPGHGGGHDSAKLSLTRTRALRQSFDRLGLRPRKDRLHVGPYELGSLLHETRTYQDREAVHREIAGMRRRARTYLVPGQTSQEARLKCRREADRDAQLLWDVREHPGILRLTEYVADAPLGPTLLFDPFEGAVPLPDHLRRHKLEFSQRRAVVEQVGLALAYCHRREVYHGGLAPEAVLVRPRPDGEPPEVRLWNFQFGHSLDVSPTLHRSNLASEPASAYQAPELFNNPAGHAVATDLFSLGALAYYLFTGQAPAQDGIDLQQRLDRDGFLDPRTAADNIPEPVADAIVQATQLARAARGDDIDAWLENFRHRSPAARVVSPLDAQRGDDLGDGLRVEAVLGQGASARVLHVVRDNQNFALKVSLGHDHDARLAAEGALLDRLRHPRIVALHDRLVLADRTCLLLALAGQRTLQQAIAEEGSIDLDLAFRYGDDLLSALTYLETEAVPHRDIKPANLGEGSAQKQTKHLTLFDFSLALADATNLRAGTELYSDPFLPRRGRWDPAADRWSAALTLHELLTGVRPSWTPRGASPLEPGATLQLARERFDPAARDRLTTFFRQALAPEAADRFPTARVMLAAWNALAEAPRPQLRSEAPGPSEQERKDSLAQVADDSPIEALPLSARARNALDRAGLTRAVELLALPANRLSAIRGAGSKVADEIDRLRKLWQPLRAAPAPVVFFAHYRGRDLPVDAADLPTLAAQALADAGLPRLTAVAGAPAVHIETLARRHGFDSAAVRRVLQALHDSADAREHPSTSQAWIDALLRAPERRDSTYVHVRRWLGLDDPFVGRRDPTVREVAEAGKVTTAAVYLAFVRAREHAQAHPSLADLLQLADEVLAELHAAPIDRAAEALADRLGDASADPAALTRSAALLRWSAELSESLVVERLHDDVQALWASNDRATLELLRRLGDAADSLADRDVLAATGEVTTLLSALVKDTPLATLPHDRLVQLAAQASHRAACSSRLELYQQGLPAARALQHSHAVLSGSLRPEEVQARVRARYPAAEPLPDRPALDALVAPLGLVFDEPEGTYTRRGDDHRTSFQTILSQGRHTADPKTTAPNTPAALQDREFSERLQVALRRRESLLLAVDPLRADEAAAALAHALGVPLVALDACLLDALDALARTHHIDPAVLHETDAAGPDGPEWHLLRQLAEQAAAEVAAALLPARAPLLLVRPGPLARYRLEDLVHRLVQSTRDPEAAPLFLLVPSTLPFLIDNQLPVPGFLPAHRLKIPGPWLDARRRELAS